MTPHERIAELVADKLEEHLEAPQPILSEWLPLAIRFVGYSQPRTSEAPMVHRGPQSVATAFDGPLADLPLPDDSDGTAGV